MSRQLSTRMRVAAVAAAVATALVASTSPASAAKPPPRSVNTQLPAVTVQLVCPAGNYEKVTNIALFDSRGNVVGSVGGLECGVGNLSTYPGPASHPQSRTVQVSKLPTRVGYQGEWRCADSTRPVGSALGGPIYIAFGPTYFSLNSTPPTTIPCQALDSSGRGYASSLRVSW